MASSSLSAQTYISNRRQLTSEDEKTADEPSATPPIVLESTSIEAEENDVGNVNQHVQHPRAQTRATYTDRNGLLLYLDPNLVAPTIRFRLSEERHAHNRCMSNLYFVLIYLLLRLWLEAFLTSAIALYLICSMGTLCLFYKLYKRRRNWDRELQRRMNDLMLLVGRNQDEVAFGGEGSYRDILNGVSEDARSKWTRFTHRQSEEKQNLLESSRTGYGSIESKSESKIENVIDSETKQDNFVDVEADTDTAVCSICLCEYEDGDQVVVLPCSHVYHDGCITTWTINHTKCPLCNFDLETNTR